MKYPNCIQTFPLYPILGILFVVLTIVNAVEVSKRFKTVLDVHAATNASTAQTKVPEAQLKLKVRVVEWQRCIYTSPDAKQSCVGMDLVRFLMSDGTIQGPYILLPTPPGYVHDPAKWTPASEFSQ